MSTTATLSHSGSLGDKPSAQCLPQSAPETHHSPVNESQAGNKVQPAIAAPPTSIFESKIHPRAEKVSQEVEGYFLEHWPFPNDKARKKFLGAGFSRVTCLYFPLALDDRIHFACRLLTVLFLIDDLLEEVSYDEGAAYNAALMPLARGEKLPDRTVPVQYIFYDLWDSMRVCDQELANEVLEPTFVFMRAQTDKNRSEQHHLGGYLQYRERDVGKALLAALMRFSMGLHLSPEELECVRDIDQNSAKHLSVINDVWSWEKEVQASKNGHKEGAALCSAVQVVSNEANITPTASKRVLVQMCREWEHQHEEFKTERLKPGGDAEHNHAIQEYIEGIEYQMSGNEMWSRTTLRYISVGEA